MAAATIAAIATAVSMNAAIISQNQVSLRAEPRDSARQQAQLWAGEVVEVRGERMDYLQVYDYKRERAGFIRADQVRRTRFAATQAPELLSVVRFVKDTPGVESLGIGFAAAYIKAAPADAINGENGAEVLDAIGRFADRLAQRASAITALSKNAETALSAQLDVAAQYGIKFNSYDMGGHMQMCYDGEAYRRVLAMKSTPEQQANAALALTRPECSGPALRPLEQSQLDVWRIEVLSRVQTNELLPYLKNRVLMRQAAIVSSLAYQRSKMGVEAVNLSGINAEASVLAQRAITDFTSVNKLELPDADLPTYNDAAMRVSATRWAAAPVIAVKDNQRLNLVTTAGQPGETCVALQEAGKTLVKRCTYGVVWSNSVSINREHNAVALAVQPMQAWRELWLFRKNSDGWMLSVLPPAATNPELGYAEFAGWVPGGKQVLVAREARAEGKYKHQFELVSLDSLAVERQSADPSILGAFQRWQDPLWKKQTLSIR